MNLDDILLEWSYKCPKGYPTIVDGKFVDAGEVIILNELLVQKGFATVPVPEVNQITTINEGATEDNSEVMVMYFCCVNSDTILSAKNYLLTLGSSKKVEAGKPNQKLKIPSGLTAKNLGGSGDVALKKLLQDYNNGKPNIKVFVNAITSAELIRQKYGGQIPPSFIDRGKETFEKIKLYALELIQSSLDIRLDAPDKWSPADIMIYNGNIAYQKAKSVDKLNKLFTSDIENKSGKIVGISLKQSSAQGGKALSFKKTLTRENHFVTADDLGDDDKHIRSCLFLASSTTQNAKSGATLVSDSDKIGYIAEIARKSQHSDPKIQASWQNLVNQAQATLIKTFGQKEAKIILSLPQSKAKDAARKLMKEDSVVEYSTGYDNAVKQFNKSTLLRAKTLYTTSQKTFVAELKKAKYGVKPADVNINKMGSSFLYRKASCYQLATWFLTGMTDGLKIPAGFRSLAKEKNPFIALTAYAIGYTGISPYFIKVIGAGDTPSKINEPAHSHQMGGDGMLEVKKNQSVSIIDSPTYAGFQVNLQLTANNADRTTYEVTLDFRFAGTQLNIEVSKIS